MPRRTNDFQKLVQLVQMATLPPGARIIESAEERAPGFGGLREIDVLVEVDSGIFKMKIALEAKDHKRKLDITDIETIIGKYRGAGSLVVDKVVLVSHHGFSNAAKEKAKLNGIELLTLAETPSVDWQQYFPPFLRRMPEKLTIRNRPPVISHIDISFCHTHSSPLPNGTTDAKIFYEAQVYCCCHNNRLGDFKSFLNRRVLGSGEVRRWVDNPGKVQQRRFQVPLRGLYLQLRDGRKAILRQVSIDIKSDVETIDMKFTTHRLQGDSKDDQYFQFGVGEHRGKKVEFFVGQNADKIIVNLGGALCGEPQPSAP